MRSKKRPNRHTRATHRYMGELFLLDGSSLWIWSFVLNKWHTLYKSFDHDEIVLLFKHNNKFEINYDH